MAAVILSLFGVCAVPWPPKDLTPIGGKWYTHYAGPWGMDGPGNTSLYHRGALGWATRVDDYVYESRFYPPDCVVYTTVRASGGHFSVCGNHVPIGPFFVRGMDASPVDLDSLGLHKTEPSRVVNGEDVTNRYTITIDQIRRRAESQPAFHSHWDRDGQAVEFPQEPPAAEKRIAGIDPRVDRSTSLVDAIRAHQQDVVGALLRSGVDANAPATSGVRPLEMAVGIFDPDTAVIRMLLDAGADREAIDRTQTTALLRAAVKKNAPVFRMLLERGADPCHRDESGKSIIDYARPEVPEIHAMATRAFSRC